MLRIFTVAILTVGLGHGIARAEPDLTSGTWHIGIVNLFGESKKGGKNLDIYPVFENCKMVNALATARQFNTSIHMLESASVVVDPGKKTVTGRMQVLITPDLWIPKDGLAFTVDIAIDGRIEIADDPERGKVGQIRGTYTADRTDGKRIGDTEGTVKGELSGGVGVSEPGWENASWSAGLTPVAGADRIDLDAIIISLGVADGKVNWGALGLAAQAKWPAHKSIPFDVSNFAVTSASSAVGTTKVTGRHLHSGGDPKETYTIELTAKRVQGLIGMKAKITSDQPSAGEDWPQYAYGRGSGRKGAGGERDFDAVLWRHQLDTRPWFTEVKGFKEPVAGEHPRLLFREADVAALRARAKTPEGRAILARLRKLLGENGEAVTKVFNATPPHNHNKSPKDQPLGTFTSWHAAGFGFLYQVTGEKKYADLSRTCVELMLAGKYDIDNRYSWIMPGTDLRCGSVLHAMAYAYDFCYDAWPGEFREKIALEMQNFEKVCASAQDGWEAQKAQGKEVPPAPEPTTVLDLAGRSGYPPGSNHYGSLIGGTGVAMLAIRNDPGVNTPWVDERIAEIASNMPRMLCHGFGDGGYYAEGFPPSRLSSEGGFLDLVLAMRNAAGRDYVNVDRSNVDALSTRWIYHIGGAGKGQFPSRGTYGGDELSQGGIRGSFALGLGTVKPNHRRALLWTYRTFFDAFEAEGEKTWNAVTYPHMAVHAFINWPVGQTPQDPDEVMPKVLVDHDHGYFVARNRWQDKDDIIVTHLIEMGPLGYYAAKDGPGHGRNGRLRVWGLGRKIAFDVGANGEPTHFAAGKDGSFVLTAGTALAVDMSGKSGADLVVVTAGFKAREPKSSTKNAEPGPITVHTMQVDGKQVPVQVYTLQNGAAPPVRIDGNEIRVGGQTFTYDGTNLKPGTFNPQEGR